MAETTTYEAGTYTASGTARERMALPAELFDGTVNVPVMHQAVKAFLANQRQGNASTKIRKYVIGGNQKPWRQKGTGRARQGSIRAPHWVGGGTVFGPTPRAYDQYLPRQLRALARKSALNARAREGAIYVVDRFEYDAPKTARMRALLEALGLAGQKVLVLTDGVKPAVYLSGRNLPTVHVMPYTDVSTYHVLWSDAVVIESAALGQPLEPTEESRAEPAERAPARRRPARSRAAAAGAGREAAAAEPEALRRGRRAGGASATRTTKTAAKRAKPAAKQAAKRSASGAAKKGAAAKKRGASGATKRPRRTKGEE